MQVIETNNFVPQMSPEMMEKVRQVENIAKRYPQLKIPVKHYIHAGVYVRTVAIPAGVMITGAHIIVDTNLVIEGHALVHTGEQWVECIGYRVIPAAANRKQIFVAITDINLTMFFATDAENVKDAEERFTSEFSLLQNRGTECQELPQQP